MNNFYYNIPTQVHFGSGAVKNINKYLEVLGANILVIYGEGAIKRNSIYDSVIREMPNANIVEFSGIKSNPLLSDVRIAIEVAKREKITSVLAIGGGSVMDSAKIIAAGAKCDFDVWQLYAGEKVLKEALPIFAVPTIAASASEMMGGAVLTNDEINQKLGFGHELLMPYASFLDPVYTFSVPRKYTAYAAADILSHILDPIFFGQQNDNRIPFTLSCSVIRDLMSVSIDVLDQPNNYKARSDMMWMATISHNGMIGLGLKPAWYYFHFIGHSFSALYNVPHGASMSVVISAWLRYAVKKQPSYLNKIGMSVFSISDKNNSRAAEKIADKIIHWFLEIGAPVSLGELECTDFNERKVIESILNNLYNILSVKKKEQLNEFAVRYYNIKDGDVSVQHIVDLEEDRLGLLFDLMRV